MSSLRRPRLAAPARCRRVLIVDDEIISAGSLSAILHDLGVQETIIETSLEGGLEAARTQTFDVALLDIHLGASNAFPIARVLQEAHVPFGFQTGYDRDILGAEFSDCALIKKPYGPADLVELLTSIVAD